MTIAMLILLLVLYDNGTIGGCAFTWCLVFLVFWALPNPRTTTKKGTERP